MENKEIKSMTLDLAKTLSYLSELAKTNNQNYVTLEGMSLLEGIVISGNGKVNVIDKRVYDRLNDYRADEELDMRTQIKDLKEAFEDQCKKRRYYQDLLELEKQKKKKFKLF